MVSLTPQSALFVTTNAHTKPLSKPTEIIPTRFNPFFNTSSNPVITSIKTANIHTPHRIPDVLTRIQVVITPERRQIKETINEAIHDCYYFRMAFMLDEAAMDWYKEAKPAFKKLLSMCDYDHQQKNYTNIVGMKINSLITLCEATPPSSDKDCLELLEHQIKRYDEIIPFMTPAKLDYPSERVILDLFRRENPKIHSEEESTKILDSVLLLLSGRDKVAQIIDEYTRLNY